MSGRSPFAFDNRHSSPRSHRQPARPQAAGGFAAGDARLVSRPFMVFMSFMIFMSKALVLNQWRVDHERHHAT